MRMGALLGPLVNAQHAQSLAEQIREFVAEDYCSIWAAQTIGRGFMMTDPFVALSVAATVAPQVEIGTAVIQAPLYHPMDLAHRVFSLQQICGDRLLLGIGAGSSEQDFAAYDRDHQGRFAAFAEGANQLRQIFAEGGNATSNLSPWPAVAGGPPLLLGSWGRGVQRAATEFDGWIASAHYRTVDEVVDAAKRYRAAGGGRSVVSTIQVNGETELGELREKLQRFAAAGFDDAVVMLLPGSPAAAEVRKLID